MRDRSHEFSTPNNLTYWQKIKPCDKSSSHFYLEVIDRAGREEVGILDEINFGEIIDLLTDLADQLGSSLHRARPARASIEMGLEFGLENGQLIALIARGSGKANLKIVMEWEQTTTTAEISSD